MIYTITIGRKLNKQAKEIHQLYALGPETWKI